MELKVQSINLKPQDIKPRDYIEYLPGHSYDISIRKNTDKKLSKEFKTVKKSKDIYLVLDSPLSSNPSYHVIIKQRINHANKILNKILKNILLVNLFAIMGIIFFSFYLSRVILIPIKTLGSKLAKMNEKHLSHVDTKNMPEEFTPLASSLNRLIDRVQTFIHYRTELFIGIAHELKTPLAVMKTKNEVTLLKSRDDKYYKSVIQQNIDSIDEMNQMISAILNIGRQEGEQLNPPEVVDLVTFIKEKSNNFKILANQKNKNLELDIRPRAFPTLTQPTLVLHVLQNFVQNAIKFSPENGTITIKTIGNDEGYKIEVIDNGCGLKDDMDIFAPFKRYGDQGGVGLGLFLAKGAAQALNANISVKNREDRSGVVATLFIPRSKTL